MIDIRQSSASDEPRVEAWERRSEWPLAVTAVVFLVAYAWPILRPEISISARRVCHVIDVVAWVVFAVDYVSRLAIARHRGRYWLRHLPDLAIVALPVLRPLRLLRLVMLLRVLNRRAASSLRGRVAAYVGGAAVILVFCAALAVLDAERGHAGSNLNNFGDAIWWAIVTVSTVGYGDHFPVTGQGRAVAIGLMLGGIAIIGVVTATIASWLVDTVREADQQTAAATRADVAAVHAQLDSLTTELRALRAELQQP